MLSGLAPGTSIADMKSEILSAFKSDVSLDALDFMAMEPPQISVESDDDFELCRALKERGKPTGGFEVLEPSMLLKDSGLSGWETIFLQHRDGSSGKHIFILVVRGATLSPSPMTKLHVSGVVFIASLRLCEYHVEVVSLYEPHALNLQAIFYQSHTLFHQCMTKKNHRKQRRTKGREQILPQNRNKIELLRTRASKLDYRGTPCKNISSRKAVNTICNDFVHPVQKIQQ